ncbi:hypothetical protein [Domibacillus tundrae]|uniref:hypothetical protein n=1 Tax=Domibacillus tundrae TaxID=1587527 RepID=UPI003396D825
MKDENVNSEGKVQKKPEEHVEDTERLNDNEFHGTNSERFGSVPDEPKIKK